MEGERGTAMAFHVGAPARWLAVLACAIGGQRKERAGKKKGKKGTAADGWGLQRSEREEWRV